MLSDRAKKQIECALIGWATYTTKIIPELSYPSTSPYYVGQRPQAQPLDEAIKRALKKNNAKWAKTTQTHNKPKPHFIKYMGTKSDNIAISAAITDMPMDWRRVLLTKYLPPEGCAFKTDTDLAIFLNINQQKCSKYLMFAYVYLCGVVRIPL